MEEIKEEVYYVYVFQDFNGKFHTSYPSKSEDVLSMTTPYTSKGWKVIHRTEFKINVTN